MSTPGFLRRLGGVLYDGLTLLALWLMASAIFTSLYGVAAQPAPRLLLQIFSLLVISGYFLWCWTHGGQTLAMRAWRVKVVYANGMALTFTGAFLRFLLAGAGVLAGGAGLWWALFDPDGQFLHDRLAKTRLIDCPAGAGA
ncbi:RDD family protein [mine drainage metagenome]|uniref:RDD family protein n=1 Tax=mine drainage metagenome TaxID=410659 RepID=A0A1J5R9H6_9ZZZZ